jgi:hypothetical protein
MTESLFFTTWTIIFGILVLFMLIKILLDDRELHMELKELIRLILRLDHQPMARRIVIQQGGRIMSQAEQLSPGSYLLGATPVDDNGTARSVQPGSFSWTLDDLTDASITPQGDGSTALFVLNSTVADQAELKIDVTANADTTGATTKTISGELDVTAENAVSTPLATSINISVTKQ